MLPPRCASNPTHMYGVCTWLRGPEEVHSHSIYYQESGGKYLGCHCWMVCGAFMKPLHQMWIRSKHRVLVSQACLPACLESTLLSSKALRFQSVWNQTNTLGVPEQEWVRRFLRLASQKTHRHTQSHTDTWSLSHTHARTCGNMIRLYALLGEECF